MIDLASQDPSGHDGHTDAAGDQLQSQSHYNSNSQPSQPHLDMVQDMMKQAHITVQEDSYYESAGLDLALKFMNSDETLLQPSDEDKDEHEQYDGRSQPATAPKPGTPSKQANSSHAHNSTLERIASRLSLRSDGDSGSIGQRSSSLSQSHVRTQSQPQAVVQSSIAKPNSGSTNSIGQTKVRRKGMKFRQSFGNIKNVLSRTVSGEMSMETAAAVSGPAAADRSFKGPVALNPQGTPQGQAQGNTQGEYLQHSRGESSSAGSRSPTKAGSVSSGCTVLSMGTHGDNGAAKIDEFDEVRLDGDFDNNNTQAVSYTNSPEFDGQSPRIRHHKGHSADLHRTSRHTTPRLSENTVRFSPQVNTEDDWKRKLFDGTAGGSSDEDEDEDNSNDRTALTTRNSLLYQSAAPRRVMTKAQFETFRKSMIGSPAFGSSQAKTGDESDESDGNSETDSADETAGLTGRRKKKKKNSKNKNNNNENGDDDDDDDENDVSSDEESEAMRLKNLRQKFDDNTLYRQSVRMRMNQDAHLSVYRQKMMKLTGQNQSFTAQNRPHSAFVTSSVDLMAGGEDDDEDDEYDNVPLGILRAHGFPTGQHPLGTGHSMGKTAKPGDSLSVSNLNLSSGGGAGMGSGLDSPRPATLGYPGSGGGETRSIHSVDALSLNGPSNRRSFATLGNRRSILFGQNELTGAPRGLIGEIAREEEARMRRRSMAGLGGYFRSPSTTNLDEAGLTTNSVQQFSPSGNGPAKDLSSPGANDPIQLQLQQMMHMQYQMLATIQGQGGAPPGSPMSPSIYGVGPRSSQATLPRGRLPNQSQVSLPALNHMGSSYSIRTQHQQQQQQQQSPMGRPFSQVNDTVDDNDDDDDDGFDDENAWRELEAKRQHIRQQWQAASATGSSPVAASSGSM